MKHFPQPSLQFLFLWMVSPTSNFLVPWVELNCSSFSFGPYMWSTGLPRVLAVRMPILLPGRWLWFDLWSREDSGEGNGLSWLWKILWIEELVGLVVHGLQKSWKWLRAVNNNIWWMARSFLVQNCSSPFLCPQQSLLLTNSLFQIFKGWPTMFIWPQS